MIKSRLSNPNAKMTIGIEFTPQCHQTLKPIIEFAKRAAMALRFTHVCELWRTRPWLSASSSESSTLDMIKHVELMEYDNAKRRLTELESITNKDLVTESNVVFGHPAEGLIADAQASYSSLIVCSTRHGSYKYIPKGFSTALSLMAQSTLPVLVVPEDSKVDFSKPKIKLMLADDLSESCESAVNVACDLSLALKQVDLMHLNVCHISNEEINYFSNSILEAMTIGRFPHNPDFNKEAVIDRIKQEVTNNMNERAGIIKNLLRTWQGTYKQQILFGEVHQELHRAVEQFEPDIMVFGRHETLHHRPFGIGKVPFHAMISFNRPFIVVPHIKQITTAPRALA